MNDVTVPADEGSNTQDEPVMEQDAVSDRAKLDGIIAQTIADLGSQDGRHVRAVVRERSAESGVSVSPGEVEDAVAAAVRKHATAHPSPGGGA